MNTERKISFSPPEDLKDSLDEIQIDVLTALANSYVLTGDFFGEDIEYLAGEIGPLRFPGNRPAMAVIRKLAEEGYFVIVDNTLEYTDKFLNLFTDAQNAKD